MAPIPALSYADPQNVLDGIDRSFQLTQGALVDLTKAFLHEFALGLEHYGESMAMMSVVFLHFYRDWLLTALVRHSSLVCPTVPRQGRCSIDLPS